jgi:hypothetical protein
MYLEDRVSSQAISTGTIEGKIIMPKLLMILPKNYLAFQKGPE